MENENPKIISLEVEGVKKIKVVALQFAKNGLSIIGGKNKNGKTSVLDSIAYLFGGEKNRPSNLKNQDSDKEPFIRAELSNGLIVERKGKNSALKVTDPSGKTSGQTLLNSFISEFALNIEKFFNASGAEKRAILLKALGDEEKLQELEAKEKELSKEREFKGREVKIAEGAFKAAETFPDAPKERVSIDDVEKEFKAAVHQDNTNRELRALLSSRKELVERAQDRIKEINLQIDRLEDEKQTLISKMKNQCSEIEEIQFDVDCIVEQDLAAIQTKFASINQINAKIEANEKKESLRVSLREKETEYSDLTKKIEEIRAAKKQIVDTSKTKLSGLEWDGDELFFNGQKWDGMSGAEQLIVSTVISRSLSPNCGFVLIDKLEQMDLETLSEFASWLKENDLQAIGTRVSTGEECSFILEDGELKQ